MMPMSPTRIVRRYSQMRIPDSSGTIKSPRTLLGIVSYLYFLYMTVYTFSFLADGPTWYPSIRYIFPRAINDGKFATLSMGAALRRDVLLFIVFGLQYLYACLLPVVVQCDTCCFTQAKVVILQHYDEEENKRDYDSHRSASIGSQRSLADILHVTSCAVMEMGSVAANSVQFRFESSLADCILDAGRPRLDVSHRLYFRRGTFGIFWLKSCFYRQGTYIIC